MCSASRQRAATVALVRAAQKGLPKAKARHVAREWKARAVLLARATRRRSGGEAGGDGEETACHASVPWHDLPPEILCHILSYVLPVTLGAAACVSKAWRDAARSEHLWERFVSSKCKRGEETLHRCFGAMVTGAAIHGGLR